MLSICAVKARNIPLCKHTKTDSIIICSRFLEKSLSLTFASHQMIADSKNIAGTNGENDITGFGSFC